MHDVRWPRRRDGDPVSDKCPTCGRPKFDDAKDRADYPDDDCGTRLYNAQKRGECTDERGVFGPAACIHHTKVDWRALALAAEAKLAEMEKKA